MEEDLRYHERFAIDYEREMTFYLVRLRTIPGRPNGKKGMLFNLSGSVVLYTMENFDKIIPTGEYKVEYTRSAKFSGLSTYRKIADGRVPILTEVPGREGIRIHIANWPSEVTGCIAIGTDDGTGAVYNSNLAYKVLMEHIVKCGFYPMRLIVIDRDDLKYYREDVKPNVEKLFEKKKV